MNSKILKSVLAATLVFSILTGCGDKNNNANVNDDKIISGENVNSGENQDGKFVLEEYIKEIDEYVIPFDSGDYEFFTLTEELTEKELGEEALSLMEALELNSLTADLKVHRPGYIFVSPYSDFMNLETYYFKDSKLVMYVCEFAGIGGSVKYYFKDDEVVNFVDNSEPEMNWIPTPENEKKILEKANALFFKYIDETKYEVTLSNGNKLFLGCKDDVNQIIGSEPISTETIETDWPGLWIKTDDYENLSVRFLLQTSPVVDLFSIELKDNTSCIGDNIKIGDDIESAISKLDLGFTLTEQYEDGADLYLFQDKLYFNRYIEFLVKDRIITGIKVIDALDS